MIIIIPTKLSIQITTPIFKSKSQEKERCKIKILQKIKHFMWPPNNVIGKGASGGVMVSKLDYQIFSSAFDSHCVPYSYDLVPHLSKMLIELLYWNLIL